MSAKTPEELLNELQQNLGSLRCNPDTVLHQARDVLTVLCTDVTSKLSTVPANQAEWEQEMQAVNNLRITAENYVEAFFEVYLRRGHGKHR